MLEPKPKAIQEVPLPAGPLKWKYKLSVELSGTLRETVRF